MTFVRRENAGTSVAGNNAVASGDASEDDTPKEKEKPGFSAFASLAPEDTIANDDDEDFGGLMVRTRSCN